jgi:hypothetical protein
MELHPSTVGLTEGRWLHSSRDASHSTKGERSRLGLISGSSPNLSRSCPGDLPRFMYFPESGVTKPRAQLGQLGQPPSGCSIPHLVTARIGIPSIAIGGRREAAYQLQLYVHPVAAVKWATWKLNLRLYGPMMPINYIFNHLPTSLRPATLFEGHNV